MFGFLCPVSGSTSSANITMAVCPHALSDPRAEVTLQESNQELRSQLAQSKQDFQALMEEFLVSEAAAYSLATELQKHKCGECKDIIESVLGDKLPFEEGKLAEKSTLAKKLRESNLLIQEQEQQLAYLRHKLQEGREVWALLSQHLNDLLTHNGSDDHQGQAFRQQLAEGYRLATHLAHILGPGNNEDKEDEKTQGTLTHRLGRDVPPTVEPPLPRACLEEYSWTCATDVGQSESCWTQSSSAVFCFQGLAVSSLADTPSQHTDPEDDGGVQDGLCCRLGRDVPPTVEPPLPRACLEEYSWTCATDVGQSESCWTQSSSAVFCFQGLAVSSLADTPSQHTDPEDDGGVQDGLCCRLGRDVPPTVEPPLPRACLEEYSWTCATDVGQSESCWTQSSSAVFCFQGLAVSSLADTPSQHTDPEDDGGVQDGLCCRLGRDVPPTVEPPLPRACLEEYSWTCATDVGQSESCWTQSSSAVFCFQGLAVSSLADTPSQHTDPEDDGGVQDGLCCRLGRDVPPTVEPPLPRACLEEYSWTCATDVGQSESCWTQSSSAVFCFQGLAVSSLADTPSQHTDPEDDGGVQDGLCCSLSSNLLYMKDNGFPKDAVNKYFFSRSIEHDLSSSYRPYSDSSLSFDRHEIFQTLDAEAPTLEAGHRGPLRTNWSFQRPELQASQTQLQPGTQVTSYLLLQLDQLDCGAGKARLGLCSTTWSFRAHDPFRNQWPLFQGLGFDASLRGKKPPKLEGDALEGSAALSAQKQKIIKRKLLFNKWRITCNFPSLQLRVLRYQDLWI
ncbi:neuroblastoma breakpoint family member 6-like isoform X4 [Equus caballus]|uniref:neuroblastoma breakpoint family member 6-like isoform X4 n=2 Tax=Equus caballus TaxID=9796 RepID=UPI0038B2EC9D